MKDRIELLKETLGLKHLNVEAGWMGFVRRSELIITSENENLPASNLIYLMLDEDEPVNYVQHLESDDYQVLIEGGPADYYLFYADGTSEKRTLGADIGSGQQLVVAAPGGTAKAIVLHEDADYCLCASVVTPAWTPTRARIGGDDAFIARFRGSSPWATEEKIRELIGPNFGSITGGETDDLELTLEAGGDIVFLGMQLDLSQVKNEMQRFSARYPGRQATLVMLQGAPETTRRAIVELAAEINLALKIDGE